jgi:predicted AAA+ superfamily ATPase
MYERELIKQMRMWSSRMPHKPLVIRGARQVGKSTLVREFAKEFDITYLELVTQISQIPLLHTPLRFYQ